MNSDYLNLQFNQVFKKETQALFLGSLLAVLYMLCAFFIKYYQEINVLFQIIYLISIFFLIRSFLFFCFLYSLCSVFLKEIIDLSNSFFTLKIVAVMN
jgi:hypothetical protein